MIKAYDYLEYSPDRSFLQNPEQFAQELEIAKTIVGECDNNYLNDEIICPICKSKHTLVFFEKWNVNYHRCHDCETIFVNTDESVLNRYKTDKRLIDFRTSEQYQKEAAEKRETFWDELLDWISFRTFRYKGINKNLNILDYGNRYQGFVNKIKHSVLCRKYVLKDSILLQTIQFEEPTEKADIILCLDKIQQSIDPAKDLRVINSSLKDEGLLFLSMRMGTGFDILTLKEYAQVFPYEHVLLPSGKGMEDILRRTGFEVLEYSTPGLMDVGYVRNQVDNIDESNYFVRSLMRNADKAILGEFQRFLQKSGMSSHGHIVAKKVKHL